MKFYNLVEQKIFYYFIAMSLLLVAIILIPLLSNAVIIIIDYHIYIKKKTVDIYNIEY